MSDGRIYDSKKKNIRVGWDNLTTQLLLDAVNEIYGELIDEGRISLEDAVDTFFNIDYREVYKARVSASCYMTADQWLSPESRDKNLNVYLRTNHKLLIRFDIRSPDSFDIQMKLDDETEQTYILTRAQWNDIKDNITITYQSILTGKEATRARHLKLYHERFVAKHFGCNFEYRTATGLFRPNYKGTKK